MKVSEMKGYSIGIGIKGGKPVTPKPQPAFSASSGGWKPASSQPGKRPAQVAVQAAPLKKPVGAAGPTKPVAPLGTKKPVARESPLAQYNREAKAQLPRDGFDDPNRPQTKIR